MADPRTKLDFLYQEALGDIGALTTRLESAAKDLQAAQQALADLPGKVATALDREGPRLADDLRKASVDAERSLASVTRELGTNAASIHAATRRNTHIALAVGMAAGALAGAAAGYLAAALAFSA